MLLMMPAVASCAAATNDDVARAAVPAPSVDAPLANHSGKATAVLAGGCFWGTQWVFEHVPGVTNVTSGYSGGAAATATYEQVSDVIPATLKPSGSPTTLRRSPTDNYCACIFP